MPIVPRVLVALDEERGGGVAREVVVDGQGLMPPPRDYGAVSLR